MIPRARLRTTSETRAVLENQYRLTPTPSRQIRMMLANKLDMSLVQVTVWFQNKRQKERRTHNGQLMPRSPEQLLGRHLETEDHGMDGGNNNSNEVQNMLHSRREQMSSAPGPHARLGSRAFSAPCLSAKYPYHQISTHSEFGIDGKHAYFAPASAPAEVTSFRIHDSRRRPSLEEHQTGMKSAYYSDTSFDFRPRYPPMMGRSVSDRSNQVYSGHHFYSDNEDGRPNTRNVSRIGDLPTRRISGPRPYVYKDSPRSHWFPELPRHQEERYFRPYPSIKYRSVPKLDMVCDNLSRRSSSRFDPRDHLPIRNERTLRRKQSFESESSSDASVSGESLFSSIAERVSFSSDSSAFQEELFGIEKKKKMEYAARETEKFEAAHALVSLGMGGL